MTAALCDSLEQLYVRLPSARLTSCWQLTVRGREGRIGRADWAGHGAGAPCGRATFAPEAVIASIQDASVVVILSQNAVGTLALPNTIAIL